MKSAFHGLIVWQKAMLLAEEVYTIARQLPKEEQFGLANQMRRSAVSIPSNIAEGSKRGEKEFSHFLRIASGSAAELETQLELAQKCYSLSKDSVFDLLAEVEKMLESLVRKL